MPPQVVRSTRGSWSSPLCIPFSRLLPFVVLFTVSLHTVSQIHECHFKFCEKCLDSNQRFKRRLRLESETSLSVLYFQLQLSQQVVRLWKLESSFNSLSIFDFSNSSRGTCDIKKKPSESVKGERHNSYSPVKIKSPSSRVMIDETCSINCGMLKIMSLVFPFCFI